MSVSIPEKKYHKIIRLVIKTGKQIKRQAARSKIVSTKPNDDLVTSADLFVEKQLIHYLTSHFPEHGIDSEETGRHNPDAEYVWILDPIDGTKYYSKGISLYSISLALQHRGKLISGIVYIPETGQLFQAGMPGKTGAMLNRHPIQCAPSRSLSEVEICLEIPNRNSTPEKIGAALEKLQVLIRNTKRVRILGVGSISLCYCAMGGFDLYLNLGTAFKYCDYAAGKVIVEKAGGEFVKTDQYLMAGRRELIDRISDLLQLA